MGLLVVALGEDGELGGSQRKGNENHKIRGEEEQVEERRGKKKNERKKNERKKKKLTVFEAASI